jgi:hypothetical protein
MQGNIRKQRGRRVETSTVGRETTQQTKNQKKEHLIQLMVPRIPKNLRHNNPFPMSMERNLQFVFEGEIQGAAAFFVKEFRANSAFSPDGVGTPSGFNEMANIYNFYKVLELKFYYRVVSNETATPQRFAVIVRDVQPSTVITTFNNELLRWKYRQQLKLIQLERFQECLDSNQSNIRLISVQ